MSGLLRSALVLAKLFDDFRQGEPTTLEEGVYGAPFDLGHVLVFRPGRHDVTLQIIAAPSVVQVGVTIVGMGFCPPNFITFAPLPLCAFDAERYPRLRQFVYRALALYKACADYNPASPVQIELRDSDLDANRVLN